MLEEIKSSTGYFMCIQKMAGHGINGGLVLYVNSIQHFDVQRQKSKV
jgi:hypothetical protein